MKPLIAVLLLSGVMLFSACCIEDPYENVDNTRFTVTDDFSREFPATEYISLELNAINGPVEVIGIPGAKTVRIWGEKSVSSESYEDADEYMQELKVSINQDGGCIRVRTQQPENTRGRQYRIDYKVRIPENYPVTITMVNGEAYLDNLGKSLHLEMVNGNIVLRNVRGSVNTGITNGNVDVQMVLQPDDRCDIRAVNGKILLSIPPSTSATVTATLTVGAISVNNLTFTAIARTMTTLDGVLGEGQGVINLGTVNGNIELRGE